MKENTVRVLVSGGHITPAVATIGELIEKGVDVILVGRETTDIHHSRSKEKDIAKELGVYFESLSSTKYSSTSFIRNVSIPFGLIQSIFQAVRIIRKHKPDVFLSFGGYVALPVALASKILGIPIITHEQTTVVGRTNKTISHLAKKVFISWPKTVGASSDFELIGNPIRKSFLVEDTFKRPLWLPKKVKNILFVTGGNQGSKTINHTIFQALDTLLESYYIVHQTGDSRKKADYKQALKSKKNLSKKLQQKYFVETYLSETDMSWLMHRASVVIGRAGANTVTELLMMSKKSVLIPLPISSKGEQKKNAKVLKALGIAEVIDQEDLSVEVLTQAIDRLQKQKIDTKKLQSLQEIHKDAAKKLAEETLLCIKS